MNRRDAESSFRHPRAARGNALPYRSPSSNSKFPIWAVPQDETPRTACVKKIFDAALGAVCVGLGTVCVNSIGCIAYKIPVPSSCRSRRILQMLDVSSQPASMADVPQAVSLAGGGCFVAPYQQGHRAASITKSELLYPEARSSSVLFSRKATFAANMGSRISLWKRE